MLLRILFSSFVVCWSLSSVTAWTTNRRLGLAHRTSFQCKGVLFSSAATDAVYAAQDQEDYDDDEYEYVEYDTLQEVDFSGSEWLVGSNWDKDPNKIDETWVRLAVDKDGKNIAIWGDESKGKWAFDVASQFLSFSKENLAGKKIWAGVVEDYYFVQGTIRGWTYWSAAAVLGQWQARRLGVDKEEAGTAPWFEPDQDEEEASDSE